MNLMYDKDALEHLVSSETIDRFSLINNEEKASDDNRDYYTTRHILTIFFKDGRKIVIKSNSGDYRRSSSLDISLT
jgi:hypothetical protein